MVNKRAYISTLDDDDSVEMALIEDSVGIYSKRKNEYETGKVCLKVGGEIINLGYGDSTISGLGESGAPVQLYWTDGSLDVYNYDNESNVHVSTLTNLQKLSKGETAELTSDCLIEPGINTQLRVTIDKISYDSTHGEDVPPIQEINILCDIFSTTVRDGSNDAPKFGQQLLDTMRENPIDSEVFGKNSRKLETTIQDMRENPTSMDEHKKSVQMITSRVENLYNLKL